MSEHSIPIVNIPVNTDELKEAIGLFDQLAAAATRFNQHFPNRGNGNHWPVPVPGNMPDAPGIPQPAGEGKRDKKKDAEFKFADEIGKLTKGIDKTFKEVNKTLDTTTGKLKNLFETTLSWGLKLSLLGVGGGAFGYNVLASRTNQNYMASQGLGITTGQMKAAHNVYGNRISGIDGNLQMLSAAQLDPTSSEARTLLNMRMDPSKGGAALPEFLQKISAMNQMQLRAMGADQTVSGEELRQLKANKNQLPGLAAQYSVQSQALNLSGGTQSSFQDLIAKFESNIDSVTTSFTEKVAKLNRPIGELSDSFTKAVNQFLNGPNGEAVFDTIANGLNKFATWIGSDQFQTDLSDFTTAIKDIVVAIKDAVLFIGGLLHGDSNVETMRKKSSFTIKPKPGAPPGEVQKADGSFWGLMKAIGKTSFGLLTGGNADEFSGRLSAGGWYNFQQQQTAEPVQHAQSARRRSGKFSALENKYGLPSNLLSVVEQTESGGNRFAVSSAGARGPFQFMPGTARDMGLNGNDVFDRDKSAGAAAKYFSQLMKHYSGDVVNSVAAYNWGMGNVDKYGLGKAPPETINYLKKILPQLQGNPTNQTLLSMFGGAAGGGSNQRVSVEVGVKQNPGSDVAASVKGAVMKPFVFPF